MFRTLALRSLLISALLLALASSGHAVTIDAFLEDHAIPSADSVSDHSGPVAGVMIGGERQTNLNWLSGPGSISGGSSGGVFSAGASAGTNGNVDLGWGAGTISGNDLQGADLTLGGATDIRVDVVSTSSATSLTLAASSAAGTSGFVLALPAGISSFTSFLIPFSSFSTTSGTGADFAAVDTFGLSFNFGGGESVVLDAVQSVPEPGSAWLVGAGLVFLGLRRRS